MISVAPATVVLSHKIVHNIAPGRAVISFDSNNFATVSKAMNIYYATQSRYRKCALLLCMTAVQQGLDPQDITYHKATKTVTLHCVDPKRKTPDGKLWPVALDIQEVSS